MVSCDVKFIIVVKKPYREHYHETVKKKVPILLANSFLFT